MAHAELSDAGRVSHFEIDNQLPTLAEKAVLGDFDGLANPTASVGLVAVNGVATTAIRSDGAPALDQGIVPTWTGLHTFGAGLAVSAGQGVAMADDTWIGIGAALERIVFDAAGDVSVMGAKFGVGTLVPGRMVEVVGPKENSLEGPAMRFIFDDDLDHPALILFPWRHDFIGWAFDAYEVGAAWKSSHVGSNYMIVKTSNLLTFRYASGVAVGANITWSSSGLNLDTSGKLGIGTSSPDRRLHAEVADAVTAAVTYAQRLSHTTSGAAAALFGVGQEHELEDAGGAMQVASEAVTLWAVATAGVESPLYRLSTYPTGSVGPGYAGFWTWDGVDGNARTVIPNGAGDVAKGGRFMFCIYLDTAVAFASGSIEALPGGGAVDLYNVGGDQFTLTVAADGSVSVVRAAGADTADIALWALWIN